MAKGLNKKKSSIPGIVIECQSGMFVAFYEHRTDIISNGFSAKEAKKNLKEMYESVLKFEEEESEKKSAVLPKDFKTQSFKEKLHTA